MPPRPVLALAAGAALASSLALTGCAGVAPQTAALSSTGYHGTEPDQPPSRPSILLTDTAGRPYDFFAETRGRPTLLYFGYTDCPDECPTAMAYIAKALLTSDPAVRAETRVVFVTTDPARDTGPRLAQWLSRYGADVVGLRGTQAQVDEAQRLVGITPAFDDGPAATLPGDPSAHVHQPGTPPHEHDRPLGDQIVHDTSIFAYDASDRLPVLYPESVTPADIRADLPVLARKEPA